jgi:hypothetical protein
MKRYFLLLILVVIAVFSVLPDTVETVPKPKARYARPFLPSHWFSIETEGCPCGYMCYYNMWIPEFEVGPPGLWVFGVTPWEQQGGTLHFRQYPDRDCEQHCFDCPPILYTADVIYIRYYGGERPDIAPEDVHLTYIPPGKYVLTSQNFTLYHNAKIWWFADDGTGQKGMSAHLETDKPVYEVGEMVNLFLQVIDQDTGESIQVDSITGEIVLPDGTRKTITTDMWAWNSAEEQYEYTYDLRNDADEYSNPQEGIYSASVTVEKAFYQDAAASCEFEVIEEEEKEGEFDCQFSEGEIEELATMYSPYMYFYNGLWGEEEFFPTYVEVMLQNSTFWEFGSNESTKIDEYDHTGDFIGGYPDQDHYLDLNSKGCIVDSDLFGNQGTLNIYYRVVCHRYEGKMYIVIQFRPFYIFNDFYNKHEGDWEFIEVLLDYHTREPIGAAYSRHLDGEYRLWDDIEKKGTHPVAYIAKDSHAAYFENGFHSVEIPGIPYIELPVDFTSVKGRNGLPSDYCLISEISGSPWLYFGGNWGYRVRKGKDDCSRVWNDGPRGPLYLRETWLDPVGWAFSKKDNKSEIIRSPYTLFSLSCPADMLIRNSAGQRLGFLSGEFVQEIPNSYVQDYDEEEAYVITGVDQYTMEVFGTSEGTFDLACSVNVWNNTRTIKYCDVPITPMTKAFLDLSSDLLLNVDTNQDGTIDFTVSPISIQLLSSQPIKPLQRGEDMIYEIVLTNQGDPSTFILDVNVPLSWSYSLSCDTVTLNHGESASMLVTVTSPADIPVQDYTIRMEATSLDDSQLTAGIDLIASSTAELVIESVTANCEGEEVILEALVTNVGLVDAENVKVQFFNGLPSGGNLLGEEIIQVPPGESTATSIRFVLPDGLYTFYVVVDPDNLISESCEYNNELSIEYLLDRIPPEAEIFFDPGIEDLVVRGVDNLDSFVDISVTEKVIKNRIVRTYTLTDDAGNTTELQLEVKHHKHEIKAQIIDMKYNEKSVDIPQNSLKIEYVTENGEVKILNQFLTIGDSKVHLLYDRNKDQSKVIINGMQQIEEGLAIVVIRTNRGTLQYQIKNKR